MRAENHTSYNSVRIQEENGNAWGLLSTNRPLSVAQIIISTSQQQMSYAIIIVVVIIIIGLT